MNSLSPIALSGMVTAGQRLAVAADNIANAGSSSRNDLGQVSPYQAKKLVATAIEPTGGVATRVAVEDPVDVPVDADGGSSSGVDIARELAQTQIASYDMKANLKVLKAADEMQKTLLDVMA